MATAKELSEQIRDITECSICSESFKEPKVLPCIHTFCLHCLKKYGQEKEKNRGDKMDCPLCRQMFTIPQTGFNGLPNNYFIIQLLQVSLQQPSGGGAEKQGVQCELCVSVSEASPAVAYCIQCCQHLCEKCIGRHKMQKFAKMHKVVNLDDKPVAEELMKMMPSYCEEHPTDEIKFYCYDCNKTFCMVCYVDKHNIHKCSDVKKSAEAFRLQLKKDIGKLCSAKSQEELKELNEEKSKFVTKVEVTGREIGERYNELRALLDKHQKELMEELKSYQAKHLKEIETRKDEVERMFLTKESFKRYCTEMNEKGTPCEISRAAKDLHARTEELVKTEAELINKKLSSAEIITLIPSTTLVANAKNWIGELSYKTEIQNNSEVVTAAAFLTQSSIHQVINRKTRATGELLSAAAFLTHPTIHRVINGKTRTTGIAVSASEIFVGGNDSTQIDVYRIKTFSLTRQIPIPGPAKVNALVACSHNNCLYASTDASTWEAKSIIHRFDLSNNSSSQWTLSDECCGLSVTRNFNLIVSLTDIQRIREYTTQGERIREIQINDAEPIWPYHSVQLSSGQFVVCCSGEGSEDKVSLVDSTGRVIKSYGGPPGSGDGQLNYPCQLSVDKSDNVIVADCNNNRVVLLSPTLTLLGYIATPGEKLVNPRSVHLDAVTGYLFIGERSSGRVLVLKASASRQ